MYDCTADTPAARLSMSLTIKLAEAAIYVGLFANE
jgi:hypothetical protein